MLEFGIVITPFLMTVTGLVQLALLHVARATVRHAAATAARAAIVILDDDPRRYGGAPRNVSSGFGSVY